MRIFILSMLSFFCLGSLKAQDTHYWQYNYGPGGFLTPGATVAYDNDKGLFYYNPALMAINPKSSVSISADIYQIDVLKIKDGIGKGKDLNHTGFRINPQMGSGTIAFKGRRPVTLGYALMRNPVIAYQATQRQDKLMQVLDDSYSPGKEYYIGQYSLRNNISETLMMAAAAVKLNSHWSVGLTAEGSVRNQDINEQITSRALVNTTDTNAVFPPLVNAESAYQSTYWHLGLRFKAGIAYDAGVHHLGLVITSPLISLKGSATVTSDMVLANLRDPGTGIALNLLANARQTGLPVTYKMPLSIAAGYTLDYGKGQVYLAGEYFFKVNNYNIITPTNSSFVRPDTGNNRLQTTELLELNEQRKAVFNMAAGVSYYLSPGIALIGSFRTDFTYYIEDKAEIYSGNSPSTSRWNNYHVQLGGNFKRRKANLRAGFLLSYGTTSQYRQTVNFDDPNEDNLLYGNPQRVKSSFFSAGLMLAYVYNL